MDKQYAADGFKIVPALFPGETIADLMAEVHDVFARKLDEVGLPFTRDESGMIRSEDLFGFFAERRADYIGCMKAVQNILTLFEMGTSRRVRDVLASLGLDWPAFSTKPLVMLHSERLAMGEAYWKMPPHQDWRSIQGSLNCVIAWIALVDVVGELGPLEVIPRSHALGLLPAEEDDWYMHVKGEFLDDSKFVSVPVNAGDAVFFSAFLLHRSGHNRGDGIRCSLQFRYNDLADPTFVARGFPDPYIYKPQRELITDNFPSPADIARAFG